MTNKPPTLHITTVDLTAWCFLRSWFRCLRGEGYPVALACTVSKFRQDLEESGAEVIDLPISRRIAPVSDLVSLYQLIKLMRCRRPQLVHTHTSKAGFLGRLAARLCGVPHIVHTIHELPQNSTANPWKKRFYWMLEYVAARFWCDHLVTVSQPNYDQITSEGIASPEKLTLVREGLDLSKYEPYRLHLPGTRSVEDIRAEFAIAPDELLLCSVGRLEKAKGHADLLRAFAQVVEKHPKARLVIVGQGHLHDELQAELEGLGLTGRALLAGWREDMLDILAACDLYVLASHYEGLGIATMEAMALARPVVCTGVGGVVDVVVDGETGFLVPAHSPHQLAARIDDMLSDSDLRQRMAAAGYRRVQEHFHDDKANAAMLELYERILADEK